MNESTKISRDWLDLLRRALFIVLFLAGLTALFYAEENWRGERQWKHYRAELEAKGELLNWNKALPPRPADAENVMKVPEMDRWFVKGRTNSEVGFVTIAPPKNGETKRYELAIVHIGPNQPVMTQEDFYRRIAPKHLRTGSNLLLFKAPEKTPEIFLDQSVTNVSEWLRAGKTDEKLAAPVSVEALSSNRFAVYGQQGDWMPAQEFLDWSAGFEPQLRVIREALKRPSVWIEGDYSIAFQSPTFNFIHARVLAQFVAARAKALILLRRPQEALAEIKFLESFCKVLTAHPTMLVSAMIDVAIHGLMFKTIEDGFVENVWNESQCRDLQTLVKPVNLVATAVDGFRCERPAVVNVVENSAIGDFAKGFNWIPRGWVYFNLINYLRVIETSIDWPDAPNRLVSPKFADAAQKKVASQISAKTPFNILARIAIPNVAKASQNAAKNQDVAHQVLIASALEIFRQRAGKYPEVLAELTPKFIEKVPHDVVTGGSMRYEKRGDGYILYSIGWDLKDDLKPILADQRASLADIFSNPIADRDWLWRGVPPARADFE
jgi:hypothetical protein